MLSRLPAAAPHGRAGLRRWAAVLAATLTLAVAGCSHSAPNADELTTTLMVAGMTEDQARCAAEAVTENLSDAAIESILETGPSGVPFDRNESGDRVDTPEVTAAREALAACRPLETPAGGT